MEMSALNTLAVNQSPKNANLYVKTIIRINIAVKRVFAYLLIWMIEILDLAITDGVGLLDLKIVWLYAVIYTGHILFNRY